MAEAASVHGEAAHRVHDALPVLDESRIGVRVYAQGGQRHQHLRGGLYVRHNAARIPGGDAAPVRKLRLGQGRKRPVHSLLDVGPCVVIGCQCLDGHAGDIGVHERIRVIRRSGQRPHIVFLLLSEDVVDQIFPRHLGRATRRHGRNLISAGVQGDQSPDRPVDPLPCHIVQIGEPHQKVMPAHIGHILSDGRQSQDHPGVVRRFGPVKLLLLVRLTRHVCGGGLVVGLLLCVGHPAGAGQADHDPFPAGRADDEAGIISLLREIGAGAVVDFAASRRGFRGQRARRRGEDHEYGQDRDHRLL